VKAEQKQKIDDQVITAIGNKLENILNYEWMNEDI